MSAKLYVGGLTYDTTEETLKAHMAQHGNVTSVAIIMDRDTGKSKGFGFVEMSTADEAQAAIANLDSQDLDGRKLTVNLAKPQVNRN